jgi:hypothetical protein
MCVWSDSVPISGQVFFLNMLAWLTQ